MSGGTRTYIPYLPRIPVFAVLTRRRGLDVRPRSMARKFIQVHRPVSHPHRCISSPQLPFTSGSAMNAAVGVASASSLSLIFFTLTFSGGSPHSFH